MLSLVIGAILLMGRQMTTVTVVYEIKYFLTGKQENLRACEVIELQQRDKHVRA